MMKSFMVWLLTAIAIAIGSLLPTADCFSQGCCSGGGGSPIAGGASQGVLLDRQMEVASSFQYLKSSKFLAGDKDTAKLFGHFSSSYLYTKIAYGVTKDFTMSVEAGYYFDKTQIGLPDTIDTFSDTIRSSGIADLILFPRYDILNRTDEKKRVELTVGLGYKIPLGKHSDSMIIFHNPITGKDIYTIKPPLVQPTNGSQDLLFYAFFFRGFPQHNFRLFTNGLYIKRGWNSLGYKFGDYASLGLFAGKTFFEKLGVTLQLKWEWMDQMKNEKNIDMVALYNIYVGSTGSRKVALVPQLSYTFKSLTIFGLKEFPLYEYMNGAQVATQTFFTFGLSWRFFTVKSVIPKDSATTYACSMNCKGGASDKPGKCRVCGMEMKKVDY